MKSQETNNEETKIGELLRQTRREQNKEISNIASYLKIKASDVEAIENENWKNITRHLYKPGLIRAYAKMLKIDDKIIEKKIKELPFESNIKNIKHRLVNIGEEIEVTPNRDMFFNFLLISILLFLVFLIIYNTSEKKTHLLKTQDLVDEINKASEENYNLDSTNEISELTEDESVDEAEDISKENEKKDSDKN